MEVRVYSESEMRRLHEKMEPNDLHIRNCCAKEKAILKSSLIAGVSRLKKEHMPSLKYVMVDEMELLDER